jgi:hypothetical protein
MLWLIPVSVVSPVGCMRMCGVEIVGGDDCWSSVAVAYVGIVQ